MDPKTITSKICFSVGNLSSSAKFCLAIIVSLGITHQAFAATAQECCDTASDCLQLQQDLQASAAKNAALLNSNETLTTLTHLKVKLQNYDLSPLTRDQKDMAGTYIVDLSRMSLLNEWKKTDAPGISEDGSTRLTVNRVCVDETDLIVDARVNIFKTFEFVFKTKLQDRNTAQGLTLHGYDVTAEQTRFFFSKPNP